MSSRLLPSALVVVALATAGVGLEGLAGWLVLLAVPAAAATAFVAVSDILEGRSTVLRAVTSGLALVLVVVGSAALQSAAAGAAAPRLATWALLAVLIVYALPAVAWVFHPVRLEERQPVHRRLRPREVEELLSRAA